MSGNLVDKRKDEREERREERVRRGCYRVWNVDLIPPPKERAGRMP